MKVLKSVFVFIAIFYLETVTLNAQIVNIPDVNFKSVLLANPVINTNGDNEIQLSEAQLFTGKIDVSGLGISDLTGIGAFSGLVELDCSMNDLTALDISNNTGLERLFCIFNPITSLNLGANSALRFVFCDGIEVSSLDISNTWIDTLVCRHNNNLTNLILNSSITYLDCNDNQLSTLDLSASNNLEILYCNVNHITALNLSNLTALKLIQCSWNNLTTIDFDQNPALEYVYCSLNSLTHIDVSSNLLLKQLAADGNQISTIDLSSNLLLEELEMYTNNLTKLDVSNNSNLKVLGCAKNFLTDLDVSNNHVLHFLACDDNHLTSLNVKNGNNTNFTYFYAKNNNLTCIEVDDAAYSAANWTVSPSAGVTIDNGAFFSDNCLTNGTEIISKDLELSAMPNPTSGNVTLNTTQFRGKIQIEISNAIGQTISSKTYQNQSSIDLELAGASGLYLINAIGENGKATLKVVKE